MTKTSSLQVEKRKIFGRKTKRLRQEDILPGNIYGRKVKSVAVQTDLRGFKRLFEQVGTTGLVELEVADEKKKRPVLIHNVQLEPTSGRPLHADFYQVDLTKKVTAEVPVEIIGEAPAIAKGGVLVQLINEIEVEALPADLPDKLVVDVSSLAEIGEHIDTKKLDYDKKKVTLQLEDPKTVIVQIEEPTKEEEEKPPTPEVEAEEEEAEAEAGEKEGEEKSEEEIKEEGGKEKKKRQATETEKTK